MYVHPGPFVCASPVPLCPNAVAAAQVAANIVACVAAKSNELSESERDRMLGMAEQLIRPIGNVEIHVGSNN